MLGSQLRRPTMRDVATRAGVSFKTVSRVVNDEDGVSADLVLRVERAIGELGYQPDDRARRLRQGDTRTGAIGFVMVDVANPFFSSLLRGIEDVATANRSLVLSGSTDGDADREALLVEAFASRRVDGLIVVSSSASGPIHREIGRGTPTVFVDLEPPSLVADIVRSDHLGGIRLAVEHLHRHGHQAIAFFGDDPSIFSAGLRLKGYRQAMKRLGLAVGPDHVHTHRLRAEQWREFALDFFARSPDVTAVVTAQNFVTIGTTHALHERGLQHTIALVGFDEVLLADVVEPGISLVPQDPARLGQRAADLLFARIDGSAAAPVREVIAPSLIARGSGELHPRSVAPARRSG
jgi:LacI family transcriptional regulator